MRKWYEIVTEAVTRGQKVFENLFSKTFNIQSVSNNNYLLDGHKGRNYQISYHDYDKSGNNYYVDIFRTVNDNGQTVYQLIGMMIPSKNGTLIDETDGKLYRKYNFNINHGFPETVDSAKIIEKLLNDLVKTGDFNQFIKDWKRLAYIESQNENKNTAFDKPISKYAGVEGKEIKEGDFLEYIWGYDQTNVDFYKVLSRKGDTVTLRKVENKTIKFDKSRLASLEVPSDKFVDAPFKKRVVDGWKSQEVSMPYGICVPWDGKPVEATHYA